jgi:outer membrane protein assembly factor BamB
LRAGITIVAIGVVGSLASSHGAEAGHAVHGLVFDDADGDGKPSVGERGIARAVVAFGARVLGTTDASGQFDVEVPDDIDSGMFWVRVPEGFRPGPVWAAWRSDRSTDVELALHRLVEPVRGPFTFVVAADTHVAAAQTFGGADLAAIATDATALDPAPAFFTVLGDITQGNKDAEFDLVDAALGNLDVPWIPVPGNHDWYDAGETWFRRYGPDNYSFDLGGVHFVVWNMAMSDDDIRIYLGAELARVPRTMPIVALTHAPPNPPVVEALRELGVAYVLTGHTHTNRIVDHDGVIELSTEPLLMGGLDFTPAGYRVITVTPGDARLATAHRTVVDQPFVALTSPAPGSCTPASSGELLVAAALDGASSTVRARLDCGTPISLAWTGAWTWRGTLPHLTPGPHALTLEARSASGARATMAATLAVCDPPPAPPLGEDWPQLGGSATHAGARTRELAPPLVPRWTRAVGGHVVTAPPIIADGVVYVATTDLADGDRGGVTALALATGEPLWHARTTAPLRGGLAFVASRASADGLAPATVVAAQIDGAVLAFDAATGKPRWREELSPGLPAEAGALFGTPTTDDGDVVIGHQRALVALDGQTGALAWSVDPVPEGRNSQSLSATAIGGGLVVGTFNRALGGVGAWDRATGELQWRLEGYGVVAINASPVLDLHRATAFAVTGADEVLAVDVSDGALRWQRRLDDAGFAWGNSTIGTPALARGVLVVPTLYRDLVALDATSGVELWRAAAAAPALIRDTHYRGAGESGFAASPLVTGDLVWAVDTSGELTARALSTGERLWRTALGVPVLAGLATSGDWLVVASYDGTVHALVAGVPPRATPVAIAPRCESTAGSGGYCDARDASAAYALATTWTALAALVAVSRARRARKRRHQP